MAKKKIIIANWKMNLSLVESKRLVQEILTGLKAIFKEKKGQINFETVICPSFTDLVLISEILQKNKEEIFLGAQNCFWKNQGNFTGEISPAYLKNLGCNYVIIGHSERKQFLKEDGEMINKKVKNALLSGLVPIICLGETKEERDRGLKEQAIINQISQFLEGVKINSGQKIIISYEPVWVVNTGQTVNSEKVEYLAKIISQRMIDLFPLPIVRNNIRIVYGGNIDLNTIGSFINLENIDGFLIGAASLKVEEFLKMGKLMS